MNDSNFEQFAEETATRMESALAEIERITDTYGTDRAAMPAGQRERYDRMQLAVRRAQADYEAVRRAGTSREEQVEAVRHAAASGNVEEGFGAAESRRNLNPWRGLDENLLRTESSTGYVQRAHDVLTWTPGLSDSARSILAEAIDSNDGGIASAFVVARSAPAYRSGFEKLLRNPERAIFAFTDEEAAAFRAMEAMRSTLTTNTGTGGYIVPLALDPNLAAIANAGIANPFRATADVQQTISSPHRAIASAGINAEWVAEGAVMADATPTFTKVDVALFKLDAYVSASFEILGDAGATVAQALPALLADARDRAEGAAFATGDGTTQPEGIITGLSAASAFVTCTTRGSFTSASAIDVFSTWAALPARARQSRKVSWFGNVSILNTVRQLGTAAAAALYTVDMSEATVPKLLGANVYEASAMTSATTSGSLILVAQDMAKYRIADHIAGPALEYVPVMFDQATGRPNGTRGWIWWERVGGKLLDTAQGKALKA